MSHTLQYVKAPNLGTRGVGAQKRNSPSILRRWAVAIPPSGGLARAPEGGAHAPEKQSHLSITSTRHTEHKISMLGGVHAPLYFLRAVHSVAHTANVYSAR